MFRKHYKKRFTSLPFVIFRLLLSLVIFGILLSAAYSAFHYFSGVDVLKVDPKALIGILSTKLPTVTDLRLPSQILQPNVPNIASVSATPSPQLVEQKQQQPQKPDYSYFEFMVVADSHNDNDNLAKALAQAKKDQVRFVVGLGDYTDVGTLSELEKVKNEFEKAGMRYFVVPGDHDLWNSRDQQRSPTENFNGVFGPIYQSFAEEGVRLLLVYNSDNYLGLGQDQLKWLKSELDNMKNSSDTRLIFVFLHEPLYHPSSIRIMGKVEEGLKGEARELLKMFKDGGVKEVFAGDTHYFTSYQEPETGLHMFTSGALTGLRNAQAPRYIKVKVYPDNKYVVEDVEVR